MYVFLSGNKHISLLLLFHKHTYLTHMNPYEPIWTGCNW